MMRDRDTGFKYMPLEQLVVLPLGQTPDALPVPMDRLVRMTLETLEELNQQDKLNPLNSMNKYQKLLYTGGEFGYPVRMEVNRELARCMLIARAGDPYSAVTIDHEDDGRIYATFAGRSDGPTLEGFVERSKVIASNLRHLQ